MESTHSPVESPVEGGRNIIDTQPEPQKPGLGRRFWIAFWTIAFTNLAASFDATTLSVALPVCIDCLSPTADICTSIES